MPKNAENQINHQRYNEDNRQRISRRILVYGRSIAPRGSFRSDCQVKAILHGTNEESCPFNEYLIRTFF